MKKALYVLGVLALVGAGWASALEESGIETGKVESVGPRKAHPPRGSQFLLIPESTNDVVGMYDPYDGTYLGDIIVEDTSLFDLNTPINAVQGIDGNIYLSDQVSDAVFVFDSTGTYLYTYADATDGLNNIRGIDFRGGHMFVTSGDDYVREFDGPHSVVGDFIADGSDPFDILFLEDGRSLLADIQGSTDNIRLYNFGGTLLYQLFSTNFPEQVQFDSEMPGEFLCATFSANVIVDFDIDGTIYSSIPWSGGRGVYRLGNGNLLATNGSGIYEINPLTGAIIETENTGSGRFIELYQPPTSVEESGALDPDAALSVNPNPFQGSTVIRFSISRTGHAELSVYSIAGIRVKTLLLGEKSAGEHTLSWDGTDDAGTRVPEGVYFIRVNTVDGRSVRKVTLLK